MCGTPVHTLFQIPKLLWKSRRKREAAESLGRILSEENTLPYYSIFPINLGFSFPQPFSISRYPALLFCHTSTDNQNKKLIACWRDQNQFKAYEARFKNDLGLGAAEWTGAVIELQKPPGAFWKRHSLAALILAIAALFGALSAIRDYFSVLFGAPYASLSYSESKHMDVVEGGPIAVPITALSEIRFAPMKLTYYSAYIKPKNENNTLALSFDNTVFASLAPGQSASSRIYGTAPEHSKDHPSPDVYEIHAAATAEAGVLRAPRNFEPPNRELWVWPAKLETEPFRLRAPGQRTCILEGTVYSSKPYPRGANVEIIYSGAAKEITNVYVDATGARIKDTLFIDVGKGTNRVLKKSFNTPGLGQFSEFHYEIDIYFSKSVESEKCQGWAPHFQTTVREE